MQISISTITILKNFATIHEHILIEKGSKLSTAAPGGVLARATVNESFPVHVGIYDLTKFLSVVSLFKAPDFNFEDSFVRICEKDGDGEVTFHYAAPGCLGPPPPRKVPKFPAQFIEFRLPQEKWAAFQKASAVLGKNEVRILSDGNSITMSTYDSKHPHGHEYSAPLEGKTHGFSCAAVFEIANLKLLNGSYHAAVTPNYAVFRNTSGYDLTYWVACDPQSTFE